MGSYLRSCLSLRMWRLCLMLLLGWVVGVQADVDMGGFGPMLCSLNEAGQAEVRAAEQVAQGWPTLNVRSKPEGTFALVPSELQDSNVTSISRAGAWLRLELEPTTFDHNRNSPRDQTLRRTKWYLTQRYTIRASTPANIPVYLDLQLLNPSLMLRASSSEPGAVSVADTTFEGLTSDQDETNANQQPPSDSSYGSIPHPRPSNYYAVHHAHERTQMQLRKPEAHRTSTPPAKFATEAPCPVAYLHIVPHSPAIPIPARPCMTERPWQNWIRWWDNLAWDSDRACESNFVTTAHNNFAGGPVTVRLEKLDLGSVPRTAMGLLVILLASLIFARALVGWAVRSFTRLSVLACQEADALLTNTTTQETASAKSDEQTHQDVELDAVPAR